MIRGRSTRYPSSGQDETYNVLDFGAVADGVIDTTGPFVAAIAACAASGGGTVFVPPGTYKITRTLVVPTAVRIVGAGADATIINFVPASALYGFQAGGTTAGWFIAFQDFTLNVSSPAAGGFDIRDQARFFRFENLNVTGPSSGTGILLSGQTSANAFHTFLQVRLRQFATCVQLSGFANSNLFDNCHFSACTDGLSFSTTGTDTQPGQQNVVQRCEFNGSTTNAIRLSANAVRNIFIGCICDQATNSVVGFGSSTNCTFVGCLLTPDPTGLASSTGITLLGCSFESTGATIDPLNVQRGLYIRAGGASSRYLEFLAQTSAPHCRFRAVGGSDGDEMRFMAATGTTSKVAFQTGSPLADSLTIVNHNVTAAAGDLLVGTAGKGLQVKGGSNAKIGTAVLVAGAKTVSTTAVTANSRIFITSNVDGGTPGSLRVSAKVNGTSFTITSSSGTDTSTVAWMIVEEA
jgi:hypothetical protein